MWLKKYRAHHPELILDQRRDYRVALQPKHDGILFKQYDGNKGVLTFEPWKIYTRLKLSKDHQTEE